MTTYHESLDTYEPYDLIDPHPEPEPVDDGPGEGEMYELADWAESTLPVLDRCAFCGSECLAPFGPVVEDVPDGVALHRAGEWIYCCTPCYEDAAEHGWSSR